MKHVFRLMIGALAAFSIWIPTASAQTTCLEAVKTAFPGTLADAKCVKDPVNDCTKQAGGSVVPQSVPECGAGVCCAFVAVSNSQTGVSGTPSKAKSEVPCFPDPLQNGACVTTGSYVDFSIIVQRIISAVLSLVGALFFVMFLWGGVRYLTAGGEADSVKKARTILVNAVIGMIIIGLSYAIVTAIFTALGKGAAAK